MPINFLLLVAAAATPRSLGATPITTVLAADGMLPWLEKVATWASRLDLPSNSLKGNITSGTDDVFVNANLARVLLATYRLQEMRSPGKGDAEFLRQGLAWCDTLCSIQAQVLSSKGKVAGYWGAGYPNIAGCKAPLRGRCAYGTNIYLGDTGTAATVLGVCHRLAHNATRRVAYEAAMRRFGTFVLEGTARPPYNKKGAVAGFVDATTGAVGCGYYHCTNRTREDCSRVPPAGSQLDCPSTSAYTIATGTTGGAFFSELYGVSRDERHARVAAAAVDYEASTILPSGEIPYLLDGANCTTASCPPSLEVGGPWPYDTLTYATEGVAGVALHLPSASTNATLVAQFARTVAFLVRTQKADGTWGSGQLDVSRSPRVVTLLSWWLRAVGDADPYGARPAVDKYMRMLREHGAAYGALGGNTITTGMAGLAVADHLAFGASYGVTLSDADGRQ